MHTVFTIAECRSEVLAARRAGRLISFVPTMGALHDGHAALFDAATADDAFVVASIFVNPAQFNNAADLAKYPRTLEADGELCQRHGVDLLLVPGLDQMYPSGTEVGFAGLTAVRVDALARHLEGASRPGHFDGVCGVVAKLFNIVQPDRAHFGQKDFQQAAILQQMVHDLDFPIEMRIEPTVREPDGLAMSSRNVRLSPTGRAVAAVLYRALQAAQAVAMVPDATAEDVRAAGLAVIAAEAEGVTVDYLEIAPTRTLEPKAQPLTAGEWVIAVAAWIDGVRLIDNVVLIRR